MELYSLSLRRSLTLSMKDDEWWAYRSSLNLFCFYSAKKGLSTLAYKHTHTLEYCRAAFTWCNHYVLHSATLCFTSFSLCWYTLKNKGASKGSSSDSIEEPFLVPQRTIQSKVLWRTISSLPFYNLKNLLSSQRTFCETERFFRC